MQPEWPRLYPDLFRKSPDFQVEVGPGWYSHLHVLFEELENLAQRDPMTKVLRVKEKLSGLRVYFIPGDPIADGALRLAEARCAASCEVCTSSGVLRLDGFWSRVRCSGHLSVRSDSVI